MVLQPSNATPTPAPSSILFARGVIARLLIWPVLRVAVDEGWGGPEGAAKRRWITSVIVDAFEEQIPLPDAVYIEELLLQIMLDEFDTEIEDDSVEQVAQDVIQLWDEARLGITGRAESFEEKAGKLKGQRIRVEAETQSDDDREDGDGASDDQMMEDEAPPLLDSRAPHNNTHYSGKPIVDEDGFTLVQGSGKRRT